MNKTNEIVIAFISKKGKSSAPRRASSFEDEAIARLASRYGLLRTVHSVQGLAADFYRLTATDKTKQGWETALLEVADAVFADKDRYQPLVKLIKEPDNYNFAAEIFRSTGKEVKDLTWAVVTNEFSNGKPVYFPGGVVTYADGEKWEFNFWDLWGVVKCPFLVRAKDDCSVEVWVGPLIQ